MNDILKDKSISPVYLDAYYNRGYSDDDGMYTYNIVIVPDDELEYGFEIVNIDLDIPTSSSNTSKLSDNSDSSQSSKRKQFAINDVKCESPAFKSDLKKCDKIILINGMDISNLTLDEVKMLIQYSTNGELNMLIERKESERNIDVEVEKILRTEDTVEFKRSTESSIKEKEFSAQHQLSQMQFWVLGRKVFKSTIGIIFNEALGYNLGNVGFYAALPHLTMSIIVPFGGQLADYLSKNHMSTTSVRKIMNCDGFGLEAVFLLVVAFA